MADSSPHSTPPSYLASLVAARCPRCRVGPMFTTGTYSTKFMDMPPRCSHCGLRFEREPGFFYGSMYISCGLSLGVLLGFIILANLLGWDMSLEGKFAIATGILLLLVPIIFRYSRVMMLYFFGSVPFQEQAYLLGKDAHLPQDTH